MDPGRPLGAAVGSFARRERRIAVKAAARAAAIVASKERVAKDEAQKASLTEARRLCFEGMLFNLIEAHGPLIQVTGVSDTGVGVIDNVGKRTAFSKERFVAAIAFGILIPRLPTP